jgi:cysteine desulfurase
MTHKYFDYASTTPTDPEVLKAMEPFFFERFGNPSSPHSLGREARKAVEESRETLARFIGAKTEDVIFTSGATESNNQALFGTARRLKDKGRHIIVSKVEHHSVREPVRALEQEGFKITYLDVDKTGTVDPGAVRSAITDETILVAVLHASNEIGTIQPVEEIGKITREKNIVFLVDAVQTVGHIPVNVDQLNCDFLSLSAHKFYGPKGVGALYVRRGTPVSSLLFGGDQERGRRASTQNVPGIVGLGKAVELCLRKLNTESEEQAALRDQLITEIPKRIKDAVLNGHPVNRLPNNAHFSFSSVEGEALLMSLDMAGIAASQGSACTSGAMEPSKVLRAIGLSDELAYGSLRLSIGRWTTREHIDYLLEQLPVIIERLRKI